MNNTFNISRFTLFFKKHTTEHYKTYLMSVAVLVGMLCLALSYASYINKGYLGDNAQSGVFACFLLLAGTIFTSTIFSDFGDKKKAIPALTLPVSHFEKYLVAWLYSFLIFQLVYIGCFYIVDFIVLKLSDTENLINNKLVNIFAYDTKLYVVFIIFTVLQSIAFFGSIFFEKLHFIKTAFSFFLIIIVLVLLNKPILNYLISAEIVDSSPLGPLSIKEAGKLWRVIPLPSSDAVTFYMLLTISILLWAGTYFKLKEKQV